MSVHERGALRVFFAYRDAPERRAALARPHLAPERYRLFGLDEIASRGAIVRHNLEHGRPARWSRAADKGLNRIVYGLGGYGGDFASLFPLLRTINASDVVFSTVDTVGIPLVLLRRAGVVRRPIVYTAIGLPERLVRLRGKRTRRLYRSALLGTRAVVSYARSEAEWLRDWLGPRSPVVFVPFGVDTDAFKPQPDVQPDVDVVSIGADPRRDFDLLLTIARRQPDRSFWIVSSRDNARGLASLPENVRLETDIPLEQVRDRLARARVVALPVRENSYSGATTTLLQAMAMGKPVVASRTDAIATGYELVDGVNCRLVPPGDADVFERTLLDVLAGADAAGALGTRARETVERSLSWERYTNALWELLVA